MTSQIKNTKNHELNISVDKTIEMGIREIWTQCRFAEISYSNIIDKSRRDVDTTFSSIHSFLSHCGIVSKLLWSLKFLR